MTTFTEMVPIISSIMAIAFLLFIVYVVGTLADSRAKN